jgi:hypothetical protein
MPIVRVQVPREARAAARALPHRSDDARLHDRGARPRPAGANGRRSPSEHFPESSDTAGRRHDTRRSRVRIDARRRDRNSDRADSAHPSCSRASAR